MAFVDPQSVTYNTVTIPLPRVSTGRSESQYTSADGLVSLSASSAYGRRTRRVLRLDHSKITADPFIPANNQKVSMSVYMVFDHPVVGYTNAEIKYGYDALKGAMTATSDLLITKLLGGES
jgi:hypothetical protein